MNTFNNIANPFCLHSTLSLIQAKLQQKHQLKKSTKARNAKQQKKRKETEMESVCGDPAAATGGKRM